MRSSPDVWGTIVATEAGVEFAFDEAILSQGAALLTALALESLSEFSKNAGQA
jgi:hypothetical protein